MRAQPWWQTGTGSTRPSDTIQSGIDISIPSGRRGAWGVHGEFRLVDHHDFRVTLSNLCAKSRNDAHGENVSIVVRLVCRRNRIKATTSCGATLGFFSKNDNNNYRGVLTALVERFGEIRCTGNVQADWNGELFVTLDIASPSECTAMAGRRRPGLA
jgi:hypothetical protein